MSPIDRLEHTLTRLERATSPDKWALKYTDGVAPYELRFSNWRELAGTLKRLVDNGIEAHVLRL